MPLVPSIPPPFDPPLGTFLVLASRLERFEQLFKEQPAPATSENVGDLSFIAIEFR